MLTSNIYDKRQHQTPMTNTNFKPMTDNDIKHPYQMTMTNNNSKQTPITSSQTFIIQTCQISTANTLDKQALQTAMATKNNLIYETC